jgi:hypothetical protein
MLRAYFEIGKAFQTGMSSLRQIASHFEERDQLGLHPNGIGVSLTWIHQISKQAEASFGRRFGLAGPARLLISRGSGFSYSGLSPLGIDAWLATRDLLTGLGILHEND